MPPDIRLTEKGFSNTWERADWGFDAVIEANEIARQILASKGAVVTLFQSRWTDPAAVKAVTDRLERIVRALQDNPHARRPGPAAEATWLTLGDPAAALRGDSNAEKALFISLDDAYSGAERVIGYTAVGVLSAAAFVFLGVPPFGLAQLTNGGTPSSRVAADPSGCPEQTGYASMVDLQSGDITWFNLITGGCSDLRTPDELRQTLDLLLADIP